MAAPLVLFVPGYPETGSAAQLAHRFAHALAQGGGGKGVALAKDHVDAISFASLLDVARFPGASTGQHKPPVGDEQKFLAEAHQSILESNPSTLKAPAEWAKRDPFVAHLDDAELGALRVLYAMLWEYSTRTEFRYGSQELVQQALSKHGRQSILVVAHGLGGMVAFDAIFKLGPSAPPIELLTVGSPLGQRIVQRRLKAQARSDSHYPVPERIRRWTNVAGGGDPMSADPTLADEFRWVDGGLRIDDKTCSVDTGWPHHRWEGYARSAVVRQVVAEFVARA